MKRELRIILVSGITFFLRPIYTVARVFRLAKINRLIRSASWNAKLDSLGENSIIYPSVVIHAPNKVKIGRHCAIAEFVHMWGGGTITIGNSVIIASHAVITSQTHDKCATSYRDTTVRSPIVICDNVWVGAGAIILPGIILGEGCIIGSGAVVTRNVAPWTTVAGVPATPISQR